jgi:phage tail sheath protein FI
MALNLASPGVLVREVDLTIGRVDPTSDKIAGLVGPFANGPVDVPTLVENEQDLLKIFGEPYAVDYQYEHWLTASSFLSYGGALRIVRSDDDGLKNAFVGAASSVKIKSLDHYTQLGYDENTLADVTIAAKNPGSWANGIRVAIIDGKTDQILSGIDTTGVSVGYGVTQSISSILAGIGATSILDGYLKGIVTDIGENSLEVKVLSHVTGENVETEVDYQPLGVYAFSSGGSVAIHTGGQSSPFISTTYTTQADWFDQQTIGITTVSSVRWNSISNRPSTSNFAAARGARFDELHVIIIDSLGTITGNAGTILEKHLNLSKAKDAEFSAGSASNWRKYLASGSDYIFGLSSPTGIVTTAFQNGFNNFDSVTDVEWDQNADSIKFASCGSNTYTLTGGLNYGGISDILTSGALSSTLTKISSGYSLFENTDNYDINFLLMGSANHPKEVAQALANKLISVAELRKDAIAFISPYRGAALTDTAVQTEVTVRNDEDITSNVISFYSAVSSSSYAIFDSGYKYMFDRFSETFRYVPLNGDIAGLCARTDINGFPWFSPAGTTRGAILNAVKLAYNPTKSQRDRLYSNRINSVIFSPGSGIVLFGDKTGLAKASAFDRINVRRLFIYLENAISAAAKDQLFEFNDEITRTNFVNIIEPFLRDVQAKRGIFDYVVICDETNNTAAVIDNNEFVADIYIKPTRSINYVGLTFVATRTGVAFEEVIGNV